MYFCSSISFDLSFVCEEASGTVRDAVTVVLSATLLPLKSPVASVSFNVYHLRFHLYFFDILILNFNKWQKPI